MPISSTNYRLTRELYKPPPKSLEQIRTESYQFPSSNIPGSPTPSLKRERHLDGGLKKKTAVVGPVTENRAAAANGFPNGDSPVKASGGMAIIGGAEIASKSAVAGSCLSRICCICHGCFFTRCCILAFLLGLLLGALITGLVVGLVFAERAEAAQAAAVVAAAASDEPVGCLQSPCPSASATCAYSMNNTQLNCVCQDGEVTSTAGINAGGYFCTFYNSSTTPLPVTVP